MDIGIIHITYAYTSIDTNYGPSGWKSKSLQVVLFVRDLILSFTLMQGSISVLQASALRVFSALLLPGKSGPSGSRSNPKGLPGHWGQH